MDMVTCTGLNGERAEVPVSELSFRPSVYGVIVRDRKVLLSSQWDGWDFPGGGMHLGETLDRTFAREIREETGLTAERGELLHVGEQFFTHPNTENHYQTLLLYFTCASIQGDISMQHLTEDEKIYVREAQWVPLEKIAELKFYNPVDSAHLIELASKKPGI
ncbi:MAG: NUDIX domain-containing protein [Candidatus Paceibacterota bacterium]